MNFEKYFTQFFFFTKKYFRNLRYFPRDPVQHFEGGSTQVNEVRWPWSCELFLRGPLNPDQPGYPGQTTTLGYGVMSIS